LERLAHNLSWRVQRVVVNQTGLSGVYALDLRWETEASERVDSPLGSSPPDPNPPVARGDDALSLFDALQEQLGLKLGSAKGPVDVLAIDHVERPDPN
jgi:uncharacterized protein (TIGR03435 family)